jgi:hypothetical protein
MVPDHSRGVETHRPALFLQPPTNINVITRDTKLRVKSTDRLEDSFAERHIAAGNVLRLLVGKEDMDWAAGCIGHTISDRPVARRWDVWASHGCMRRIDEDSRNICEPVGVRIGIIVHIRHDLAGCRFEARVASAAQPTIVSADQMDRIIGDNLRSRIGRPIIDDDYLESWIF